MSILDNLESYLDFLDKEPENLSTKIFSETVCKDCFEVLHNESKPMIETDNMGRDTSTYN
jgi:hypothetical protein